MSHLYGKGTSWDWTSLWIPADVTAAYEKASAEPDYAKSVVLWQQFSKMIVDQYCLSIPVMAPFRYLASYKNVHDLDLRVYAMGEWLPSLAWMSK
jgi:ABC-type transport system substrate-binding protein